MLPAAFRSSSDDQAPHTRRLQGIARSALLTDAGIEPHSRASLSSASFILNTAATPTSVRAMWAEFVRSEIVERRPTAALLKFARAHAGTGLSSGGPGSSALGANHRARGQSC